MHPEAERIKAQLIKDPLLREYVNQVPPGEPRAPIANPWEAIAEQRMWALNLLIHDKPLFIGWNSDDSETVRAGMAVSLNNAETFLWQQKIFDIARECPLPDHVIGREILPAPISYHSFQHGLEVELATIGDVLIDSMLIFGDLQGFTATFLGILPDETPCAYGVQFKAGLRFPKDFDKKMHHVMQIVLGMLAFLKSPYTKSPAQRLERAIRRRIPKPDRESRVSVVVLRAKTAEAVAHYEADCARSIEYTHQWWVRGHYRAQWYPSIESHEVIWIAPYLKGPEGAPIKERVYAVTR